MMEMGLLEGTNDKREAKTVKSNIVNATAMYMIIKYQLEDGWKSTLRFFTKKIKRGEDCPHAVLVKECLFHKLRRYCTPQLFLMKIDFQKLSLS